MLPSLLSCVLTNEVFHYNRSNVVQFVVPHVLTEQLQVDSFAQVVLATERVVDIAK